MKTIETQIDGLKRRLSVVRTEAIKANRQGLLRAEAHLTTMAARINAEIDRLKTLMACAGLETKGK